MCNTLELFGIFVCWGWLKKLLGCGLLGGVNTQPDTTMNFYKRAI